MERRTTQSSPSSSTDNASLISLQDIVFGDLRSSAIIYEEKEKDGLSVETPLDDIQRWKEYTRPLVEKEDIKATYSIARVINYDCNLTTK